MSDDEVDVNVEEDINEDVVFDENVEEDVDVDQEDIDEDVDQEDEEDEEDIHVEEDQEDIYGDAKVGGDGVEVDGVTYIIDDEQLEEIEYYEILSVEELVKDNPSFMAFSKSEIFNELMDFFQNTNKSDTISDWFFKDKTKNLEKIDNIVFLIEAEKKNDDVEEFVNNLKKLSKQRYKISQKDKNNLFFAFSYDDKSSRIRLRPYMNTTFEMRDESINSRIQYRVYDDDDTNIPIISAYFKRPISIKEDHLSKRIIGHLESFESFNFLSTDTYSDLSNFLKTVIPSMKTVLSRFPEVDKDDFDMDYSQIDAILKSFDHSMEDITVEDSEKLIEYLKDMTDISSEEIKYTKHKLSVVQIKNNKLNFYEKISNIIQLIRLSESSRKDYENIKELLENEREQLNVPDLPYGIYKNTTSMINAVLDEDTTLDEIMSNLSENKKAFILKAALKNVENILDNDEEYIEMNIEQFVDKFSTLKSISDDVFKLHFLDFHKEMKSFKIANDYSNYEGVPEIYKNTNNFDMIPDENDDIDTSGVNIENVRMIQLEKYWKSMKYKDAKGFTEILSVILPILNKIHETAKVSLDYDIITDELYRHFSSLPNKFNILFEILNKNSIKKSDDEIKNAVNKENIVNTDEEDLDKYTLQAYKIYKQNMEDVLCTSLAKWSLMLYEDAIDNYLKIDYNKFEPNYADLWSIEDPPYKVSKRSILVYLCSITDDIMSNDSYNVITDMYYELSFDKMKEKFSDVIERLNSKNISINKVNKGTETKNNLYTILKTIQNENKKESKNEDVTKRKELNDKLLEEYIKALIYMPSYNYKKVHKYLKGCCLQEIGDNFEPYSDWVTLNRKDLKIAKNNYASNRNTNKSSDPYYFEPIVEKDVKVNYESEYEPAVLKNDIEDESLTLERWLKEMEDVSNLLPNFVIEEILDIKKDFRKLDTYTEKYIEMLCKTAGRQNTIKQFKLHTNYSNILNLVASELNKIVTNTDDEKDILVSSAKMINNIISKLRELSEITNEYDKKKIEQIRDYVVARSLCLPCKPETSLSKSMILIHENKTSNTFIDNITKTIYSAVTEYLRSIQMPTDEENTKMMDTIREQNKNQMLSEMNAKSEEEKALIKEFKETGLKYKDYEEDNQNTLNQDVQDDYEQEGENEFLPKDSEEDYDD
jgi:hypothetical protein